MSSHLQRGGISGATILCEAGALELVPVYQKQRACALHIGEPPETTIQATVPLRWDV